MLPQRLGTGCAGYRDRVAAPAGGVAARAVLGDHDRMTTVRPGWTSWAPSGRLAVPVIVVLVIVANLVGVATVTCCSSGSPMRRAHGTTTVLLMAAGYLVVALRPGSSPGCGVSG